MGDLERLLDAVESGLTERNRSTRAFVGTLKARAAASEDSAGLSTEALVTDLIGILCDLELRIAALEERGPSE